MFATAPNFSRLAAGVAGALVFAGACLGVAAGPANASVVQVARSEAVRYHDLNLADPQGRSTFEMRVRAAAERVCDTRPGDLASRSLRDRCVKSAIADATSQLTMTAPQAN